MKIYYDDDASIDIIKNFKVTIVGYGSQGHAHANNLKDSGVNVTVALRESSNSWNKATDAGLNVKPVADSIDGADLVMILAPDEFQKGIYESQLRNFGEAVKNFDIALKKSLKNDFHRKIIQIHRNFAEEKYIEYFQNLLNKNKIFIKYKNS